MNILQRSRWIASAVVSQFFSFRNLFVVFFIFVVSLAGFLYFFSLFCVLYFSSLNSTFSSCFSFSIYFTSYFCHNLLSSSFILLPFYFSLFMLRSCIFHLPLFYCLFPSVHFSFSSSSNTYVPSICTQLLIRFRLEKF